MNTTSPLPEARDASNRAPAGRPPPEAAPDRSRETLADVAQFAALDLWCSWRERRRALGLALFLCGFWVVYVWCLGNLALAIRRIEAELGADELINRLWVSLPDNEGPVADRAAGSAPERTHGLCELPGLRAGSPTLILDRSIGYLHPDGSRDRCDAVSLPTGDALLAAAAPGSPLGLKFLSGGPLMAEHEDRPAVLVSADFCRKQLGADPARPPRGMTLLARRHAGPDLPIFDGRIAAEIVGVFEYPEALRYEERYATDVVLAHGFARRLSVWSPEWSFFYPERDSRLDFPLVAAATIWVPATELARLRGALLDLRDHGRISDAGAAGGEAVRVTLDPVVNPAQRVTPEALETLVREVAGSLGGESRAIRVIETTTVSASATCGVIPALDELRAPAYSRALLRFQDQRSVRDAEARLLARYLRECCPEALLGLPEEAVDLDREELFRRAAVTPAVLDGFKARCWNRYRDAMEKLIAIRDAATRARDGLELLGLIVCCASISFACHAYAASRMPDARAAWLQGKTREFLLRCRTIQLAALLLLPSAGGMVVTSLLVSMDPSSLSLLLGSLAVSFAASLAFAWRRARWVE